LDGGIRIAVLSASSRKDVWREAMELLEKNIRLFRKMKDLAFEQRSCLEDDRLDAYFNLSREREHLRSQITLNQKTAGSLAIKAREGFTLVARKHATEMMEVLRLIQDIDTRIKEMLIRKKESLASEIRDLKKGHRAVKGYHQRSTRPSKFIDRES
jgi:hypothetical protein